MGRHSLGISLGGQRFLYDIQDMRLRASLLSPPSAICCNILIDWRQLRKFTIRDGRPYLPRTAYPVAARYHAHRETVSGFVCFLC
jgi:hypothetical protein